MTTFGERIKEARKSKRMTQADLAKAANISIVTVNYLEKGGHEPNGKVIFSLAKALDINFDELWILAKK